MVCQGFAVLPLLHVLMHDICILQSFADMWVDFLLKEGEEREKRESSQNVDGAVEDTSPSTNNPSLQIEQRTSEFSTVPLASPHSDSRFSRQIPRY